MKRAALRYAEILEKGAWVTHQEQAEIAKLLRSLVMNDDAEDRAWDELETRLNRQKQRNTNDIAHRPWVSLTDNEIAETVGSPIDEVYLKDFRKVEAKLKEKNNKPEKKWVGLENIDFQYQPPAEVITMKYAEAILKEKNK